MQIELKILEYGKKFYQNIKKKEGQELLSEFNTHNNLPKYATLGSAAVDLRCIEDMIIHPGEVVTIKTGLSIHIGSHLNKFGRIDSFTLTEKHTGEFLSVAGLLLPRSGLGADKGLVLANLVGLYDADYQGEILIKAWNRLAKSNMMYNEPNRIEIKAGDRVAQMLFIPTIKAQWVVVDEFSEITSRGEGGYGSTGV